MSTTEAMRDATPPKPGQVFRDPRIRSVEWKDLVPMSRWETLREVMLSIPWLALSLFSFHLAASVHWALILAGLFCSFYLFLTGLRQVHNAHHGRPSPHRPDAARPVQELHLLKHVLPRRASPLSGGPHVPPARACPLARRGRPRVPGEERLLMKTNRFAVAAAAVGRATSSCLVSGGSSVRACPAVIGRTGSSSTAGPHRSSPSSLCHVSTLMSHRPSWPHTHSTT